MRAEDERSGKTIQVEKKEGGGVVEKESSGGGGGGSGSTSSSSSSKAENADLENAVAVLLAMGFDDARAREVLPAVGNDVRKAIEVMSSSPGDPDPAAGEAKSNGGKKQRYNVTIPAGLTAGENIAMPLPSGKQHVLKIPAGYDPAKPMDVVVEV